MTYAECLEPENEFLPVGTSLLNGTYTISDHLGAGGFGLTYLAGDQIGRKVVLKECFPASVCQRQSKQVRPQTRSHEDDFAKLIQNFVGEARQLAKLKHENVVPVLHFFEENDTAYMALEHIDGLDLTTHVEQKKGYLTPRRVMDLARQLVGALDYLHRHGVLHRDIAPDNIIVSKNDTPVLIDFGASRNAAADAVGHSIYAVKDGYSPQEFYLPGEHHSPASDIYSLAATFYTLITGQIPVDAHQRLLAQQNGQPDPLHPLAGNVRGYPESFLRAIDSAMALMPADRPQHAAELQDLMLAVTPDAGAKEAAGSRKPHLQLVGQPAPAVQPERSNASQPRIPVPTRPSVSQAARSSERPTAAKPVSRPAPGTPEAAASEMRPASKPAPGTATARRATVMPGTTEPAEVASVTEPVAAKRSGADLLPPLSSPGPDALSKVRPKAPGKSSMGLVLAGVAALALAGGVGGYVMMGKSEAPASTAAAVPATATPATTVAAAATAKPAVAAAPAAEKPQGSTVAPSLVPPGTAPEVKAAAAPVVAGGASQEGWKVDLSFALSAGTDPDGKSVVIFTGGEQSPYPAGTILTEVGSVPVGSDPTSVPALAAAYFAQHDPMTTGLPVRVTNPLFGSSAEADLPVTVSRKLVLAGFEVAQTIESAAWDLRVSQADPSSGLKQGDRILSDRESGRRIEKASDLAAILEGYARIGQPMTALIVERNGVTKVVELSLGQP